MSYVIKIAKIVYIKFYRKKKDVNLFFIKGTKCPIKDCKNEKKEEHVLCHMHARMLKITDFTKRKQNKENKVY